MTPASVLAHIADQEKVTLRESAVAEGLGVATGDAAGLAELEACLRVLKDAGDVCRWTLKGRPVVTLSSVAAYRFRLRLNPSSTRWLAVGEPDRPDRNNPRRTAGGARVMCESDMAEEPPGMLANLVDKRTEPEDDPDFGRSMILAEEAMMGLVRPTLPLVGIQPWTPENWERAPDAHVCDPLDDPRRVPGPGDEAGRRRRLTPEKLRAIRPRPEDCPVCHGRELRSMIGLVTRKAGRNRAAKPPEIVDGTEYCCRCGRHAQDAEWPRVFRITDQEANGKADQ